MLRSLITALLLCLSISVFSQINVKGYVVGKEISEGKVPSTKMSLAGQYGHFEANTNGNGIIHTVRFKPQKSGSPTLFTKEDIQKFISSLKHYFRVDMKRESNGKNGVFKGSHNGCKFVVNYKHKQFNNGSYYHVDLVIYDAKLGSI